jgi:hypothetical protein
VLNVKHRASARAHRWTGALGRRRLGDPTARWSLSGREVGAHGLVLDGGRTIRGRAEAFTLSVDPGRPVRLVLRSGGKPGYPWNEALTAAVTLEVSAGGTTRVLDLPPPAGTLAEYAVELPAPGVGALSVAVRASRPYHAFHWFALQPD